MLYKLIVGRRLKVLRVGFILITLTILFRLFYRNGLPLRSISSQANDVYLRGGPFESYNLSGFANMALPIKRPCESLAYSSIVGVQKSMIIQDDFRQVALAVDAHPKVIYDANDLANPEITSQDLINRHWSHALGSSIWLPRHQVYLLVTRVIFSDHHISWLRGRVFNENWEHLDNYTLTWGDQSFLFPRIFDIDIPWRAEGQFYGPEDPRVVLEDVDGAEPVIVFNMIAPIIDWKRGMFVHRPFSNVTSLFTVEKLQRNPQEKNWSPFFVAQYAPSNPSIRVISDYIHFVYAHKPLRIIRCRLRCGSCDFIFNQQLPSGLFIAHRDDGGDLRGGTNLVPVPIPLPKPLRPRIDIYVALPRTHVDSGCGGFYRPELMVLIRVDDQYYISFASKPLQFGHAIVEPQSDRCSHGRIMIPNSLARWDLGSHRLQMAVTHNDSTVVRHVSHSSQTDVMTTTFGINDDRVDVVRISGLLALIKNLPQVKALQNLRLEQGVEDDLTIKNLLASWVTWDILGCLVEAAIEFKESWMHGSGREDEVKEMKPDRDSQLSWKEYETPERVKELDRFKNQLLKDHVQKERDREERERLAKEEEGRMKQLQAEADLDESIEEMIQKELEKQRENEKHRAQEEEEKKKKEEEEEEKKKAEEEDKQKAESQAEQAEKEEKQEENGPKSEDAEKSDSDEGEKGEEDNKVKENGRRI